MNEIVGIDLGTTNSLICGMEAGFPILIADANGARLTPSVVSFQSEAAPLVGQAASRMRAVKPADTIYSIKCFIGLRDDEPSRSWNSSHPSRGCSQEDLRASGGAGLLYCFAAN